MMFFFFFQAEDGIRDKLVTGVQTCALPIVLAVIPVLDPFRDVARQIEGAVRPFPSRIAANGLEEIVGKLGHLAEQSERRAWGFRPPGKRPLSRPAGSPFPLGFGG